MDSWVLSLAMKWGKRELICCRPWRKGARPDQVHRNKLSGFSSSLSTPLECFCELLPLTQKFTQEDRGLE